MNKKRLTAIAVSCAVLCSLIFLLLVGLFAYARYISIYKSPLDYKNSMWISEDYKISFVSNRPTGKGELKTSDGVLVFEIMSTLDGALHLYSSEEAVNEPFEIWGWTYHNNNKFSATVISSSFFPIGTVITFYRTDLTTEN